MLYCISLLCFVQIKLQISFLQSFPFKIAEKCKVWFFINLPVIHSQRILLKMILF